MFDKIFWLFIRNVRRLDVIHKDAPSYFVAALCFILFGSSLIGSAAAYQAGWYWVAAMLAPFAPICLAYCIHVLSELGVAQVYRKAK